MYLKKLHLKINFISVFIILFINSIFLLKYSSWLSLNPIIAISGYILFFIFTLIIPALMTKYNVKINKYIFLFIIISFSIMYIIMLYLIKQSYYGVDRGDAINILAQSLINFQYPYSKVTHLHNHPSGLVGLGIIFIPFYLLKDIGYMQIFSFIIFSLVIYKITKHNLNISTILTILIGTMPAFFWEIMARSELFSTNLLFIAILLIAEKYKNDKSIPRLLIIASMVSLLLNTRFSMIIPFLIYFLRYFRINEIKYCLIFLLVIFFISIIFTLPYLIYNTDATLYSYGLQLKRLPFYFNIILILFTTIGIYYSKNFYKFLFFSGCTLFLGSLFAFLITSIEKGFMCSIFYNYWDISYFIISLPYLMLTMYKNTFTN
jgi:hypothetical protein